MLVREAVVLLALTVTFQLEVSWVVSSNYQTTDKETHPIYVRTKPYS
ncbi:MAG: hypothetical protein E1N59_2077 [Puniceicoccaceae bacterium 5H]|nr:MAG: hypothetical protein E1N59_2077 [Puniceicoccaceae bacterium 5H]